MPQSTASLLEAKIRQNRLLDLTVDWSDELIFPYYNGLSLPNIAHSIAAALGHPMLNTSPLLNTVWQDPVPQAKRVITFLLDGLGYQHLHHLMADDPELQDAVAELNGGREIIPLTSVAPSTTAVALTSTWTGLPPAATGMTGTVMFLRELSLMADMLTFRPLAGNHPADIITDWGMPPEKIVPVKGLSEHLSEKGVATYTVTNSMYVGSGLSRILHRGVQHIVTHLGKDDFIPQIASLLDETRGTQSYIGIYWSSVDALAHRYGANHEYTNAEIRNKILALRDLARQPGLNDGETLFILFADHGHYDSTKPIAIADDSIIADAMIMGLAGDERHAYLYVHHSAIDDIKAHIHHNLSDILAVVDSQQAVEQGYFGDYPRDVLRSRIGNLILLPRIGYIMSDPFNGTLPVISRHAGLSDREMLIPFIWKLS